MDDARSTRAAVIDASVALKWQLEDEQHTAEALTLRDDLLVGGRITPYAPDLYLYELINGVVGAVRRQRLQPSQGAEALRNLFSIQVQLRRPPVDRTYDIALEYGLSAYDSSYVALAESLGAALWTADRHLHDAVGGTVSWINWIGDYTA